MTTSESGLDFIKRNEGFISNIGDDVGHKVIGYGHDLSIDEIKAGMVYGIPYVNGVTKDQADTILERDVAKVDATLNRQNLADLLNQNQWDAIADFCYNAGQGATIQLLAHGIDKVPAQLPRWVHAGTNVLPGLVARRQAEIVLWNTIQT